MGKDPAYLMYYKDFELGTRFLSDDQVGKYVRAINCQADRGVYGTLSTSELKTILKDQWDALIHKFQQDNSNANGGANGTPNGTLMAAEKKCEVRWYNKRLRDVLKERSLYLKKQSESGKKGANSRWQKELARHGGANSDAIGGANGAANGVEIARALQMQMQIGKKKEGVGEKGKPPTDDGMELAKYFWGKLSEWNETMKKPNLSSWGKDFDSIIRIDGKKKQEIRVVIDAVSTDHRGDDSKFPGWRDVILSPKTLRKKLCDGKLDPLLRKKDCDESWDSILEGA